MFKVGDIISYQEMCSEEKTSLQKGMNFRIKNGQSIILMSLRKMRLMLIELKTAVKF